MTTTTRTRSSGKTIGQLLKEKRDRGPKAPVYRKFGVVAGTYDMWEADGYIPGDEHAEALAEHLELDLADVVWMLYAARVRHRMGGYVAGLLLQPLVAA